MLTARHYLLLLVVLINTLSCGGGVSSEPAKANSPPTSVNSSSTPKSLQQIADNALKNSDVSGMILLSQMADEQPKVVSSGLAVKNTSLFKIASISKLFIAVAVTRLANENTLSMQDTVVTWLPELASDIANAETATLLHLVTHRSGIPDFDSQPGFSWDRSHTNMAATLKMIIGKPADFSPGMRYQYSNSNYLLLGMVLDRALGFNHEDYIKNEILDSLGMHNSYLQQVHAPQELLATGYWDGRDKKAQEYKIPGGSMVASVQDICVFMAALNRGTLLSEEEAKLYPYYYEHTGWLPGYQSVARYDASSDTVIVIFTANTGGESSNVTERTFNLVRNIARQ
ncbi:serine hydrolase domain-containing protein [Alteromonas ponticola]|uniref:Beta-lactamase family protein n=1 Tax=Alteromonas ponticola TaxID=2720613 RepID=A0ABX1R005_9ALTE|nr:serine hydrolase domain-containing protein [Alteromonas ponticola]NMH59246.1 beta-lactamase family protein [Alteromonas ponticola]